MQDLFPLVRASVYRETKLRSRKLKIDLTSWTYLSVSRNGIRFCRAKSRGSSKKWSIGTAFSVVPKLETMCCKRIEYVSTFVE
jgi:hypothetical protein